ncbi:hypothetical protein GCM10022267_90920 [Lentzea roselyniae]|uniref:Antimicrobial peptide system protein, SdpA family n=1 Tax=Lentzea roselyniae TaxID=531940 RepID=A0ABP7CKS1_9PSEU
MDRSSGDDSVDDDVVAGSARGLGFTALVLTAGFVLGWLAQLGVPGLGGFSVLWPQHWKFFTGLERDSVVAYRVTEPGRMLLPIEDVEYRGLGNAVEVRYAEAWQFALRVPDARWQACSREDVLACGLELAADNVHRMRNESAGNLLCGHLALSVERTDVPPVGRLPAAPTRVYRMALVDIECG